MRGNGFRKSFCTKGSQKQNQKLARSSLNPGLAALSWPGCSLCVLLGLIAVGLYSCYGSGAANSCAAWLRGLAQGAEHQQVVGSMLAAAAWILLAQSFLPARQAFGPSFCPETPLFFIV